MTRRRPCELHGPDCRGPWSSLGSRERAAITRLVLEVKGRDCWVKGCTTVASTPDHIVPDSVSHDHRLANLRPSCLHHNQSRGAGPSGDGAYGWRITLLTDELATTPDPFDRRIDTWISAPDTADAWGLPITHPIVRAAMSAALRSASSLTTPGHLWMLDPAASPADLDRLVARGATVVGTPHPPTPHPSRAW